MIVRWPAIAFFGAVLSWCPALPGLPALPGTQALAAAGPAPLPPPDPTARNMTRFQIEFRALDACQRLQSRLLGTTRDAVLSRCDCYAKGTVRAMTGAEIEDFRATGYFGDSARQKALGFIDSCGLKRP